MIKNAASRARAVAFSVLAAGGLLGCHSHATAAPDYQGIVEYEERVLGFELGGRVLRVDVKRGDVVADKQPLAEVDATLEKLSRDARASEIETARADVALLEAGARREDVAALAAQVRAAAATEGARPQERRARPCPPRLRSDRAGGGRSRGLRRRSHHRGAEIARAAPRVAPARRSQRGARRGARARLEGATAAVALADERLARYVLRAPSAW